MSTACIVAGGQSTRMGTAKATLLLEGKTVLERLIAAFEPYYDTICLVTRKDMPYDSIDVPKTFDRYVGVGPAAGVHAGLTYAPSDPVLMMAVDMPFAAPEVGQRMIALLDTYEAVVPIIGGKRHPLFAVYRKNLNETYEAAILSGRQRVESIYENIHVRFVTAEELGLNEEMSFFFFFNMNTPDDYLWAQENYHVYERLRKQYTANH